MGIYEEVLKKAKEDMKADPGLRKRARAMNIVLYAKKKMAKVDNLRGLIKKRKKF